MPDDLPAPREGEALIYATPDGSVHVEVVFGAETFWLTQRRMAELFGVDVRTVSEQLGNIFATGELDPEATVRRLRTVRREGAREVARTLDHFNLDAVISVGYRVNSRQATQFRIWATQTLKEFIVKGFVRDDERLKQGSDRHLRAVQHRLSARLCHHSRGFEIRRPCESVSSSGSCAAAKCPRRTVRMKSDPPLKMQRR